MNVVYTNDDTLHFIPPPLTYKKTSIQTVRQTFRTDRQTVHRQTCILYTDRQTDRHTVHRQRDMHTVHRQTDTDKLYTDRQIDRQTDRQTSRKTDSHTHRDKYTHGHTQRHTGILIYTHLLPHAQRQKKQ